MLPSRKYSHGLFFIHTSQKRASFWQNRVSMQLAKKCKACVFLICDANETKWNESLGEEMRSDNVAVETTYRRLVRYGMSDNLPIMLHKKLNK